MRIEREGWMLPDCFDTPGDAASVILISQWWPWRGCRLVSSSSSLSSPVMASTLSNTRGTWSSSRRGRTSTSSVTPPLPTSGACGHTTGLASYMTHCTLSRELFRSDQFLTVGSLQSADTVMEEVSPDSGFSWIKSSTRCGLRTGHVDTRVAGNWKCHLGKLPFVDIFDFLIPSPLIKRFFVRNISSIFGAISSGHFKYCSQWKYQVLVQNFKNV